MVSLSSLEKAQRWMELSLTEMERQGRGGLAENGSGGNIKSSILDMLHLTCVLDMLMDVEQAVKL